MMSSKYKAFDPADYLEDMDDVAALQLAAGQKGVILTQTTLSQDDTADLVEALQQRFPQLELPSSDDICYATQNRQNAVKQMGADLDLLLVVGSKNSSNSQRLTEVARARGIESHLIDGPADIRPEWLGGVKSIGLTSGASAPEDVVQSVVEKLQNAGVAQWSQIEAPDENVVFNLPGFTPLTNSARP